MTLPSSVERWPRDARGFYEERAGHRQYDGKMPQARAEAAAEEDTRRWWARRKEYVMTVVRK